MKLAMRILCAVGCLLGLVDRGWADRFELANGGIIEGELLNPEQSPRTTFFVELDSGGRVSLPVEHVKRVVEPSEEEKWYQLWLPRMPNDVRGNLIMAEQCQQRGLKRERIRHLEAVLELDPDNETARYGLGYSRIDGEWVNTAQWNRQNGYIRYGGDWRIPQEVEVQRLAEEQELAEKEWGKRIKLWHSWLLKRRGKEQEALQNLAAVRDVVAAPAIARLLEDEKQPPDIKRVYITALANLPGPVAVAALLKRAIEDNDAKVRDGALDELEKIGRHEAVRTFIGFLEDKDNAKVNRAAAGLARMKDPSATPALIEALSTKHVFQNPGGGGMNPTFGRGPNSGGLGSFSFGGKPSLVQREIANEQVKAALIALHPGTNFGFNRERWKDYWVNSQTPDQVDLRRSE